MLDRFAHDETDLPIGDLDSPQQMQIASLVRGLSSDEPSLAWRASLNEKLRADAKRQRGFRFARYGALTSGLVAASFAFVFFLSTASNSVRTSGAPSSAVASPIRSSDLMAIHGEGLASGELSAIGPSGIEADLTDAEIRDVFVSQML